MAAYCSSCTWTGTSSQVIDGGRCPECKEPIRYGSTGATPIRAAIANVADFNRRASIALRDVDFGAFNTSQRVVETFQAQYAAGAVSSRMQQAIYNVVHRYRRQISDQLLRDYAVMRAKGAD